MRRVAKQILLVIFSSITTVSIVIGSTGGQWSIDNNIQFSTEWDEYLNLPSSSQLLQSHRDRPNSKNTDLLETGNFSEPDQKGISSYNIPIVVPPGRQLEPQLAITYRTTKAPGALGIGWGLSISEITVDTSGNAGAARYNATYESEAYILDGEQLTPTARRTAWRWTKNENHPEKSEPLKRNSKNERKFIRRSEGKETSVIRHGTSTSTYWWEVKDNLGNRKIYGGNTETKSVNENSVLRLTHENNAPISVWKLTEEHSTNKNVIYYHYDHCGLETANRKTIICSSSTKITKTEIAQKTAPRDLLISQITYPHKNRVKFVWEDRIDANGNGEVSSSALGGVWRGNVKRLKGIQTFHSTNQSPVKSYRAQYETYEKSSFFKNRLKSLVIGSFSDLDDLPEDSDAEDIRLSQLQKINFEYFNYGDVNTKKADGTNLDIYAHKSDLGIEPEVASIDAIEKALDILGLDDATKDGFGHPSSLNSTVSRAEGVDAYFGFRPLPPIQLKELSAGFHLGSNHARSWAVVAQADIDGDGLSDLLFRSEDKKYHYLKNCLGDPQAADYQAKCKNKSDIYAVKPIEIPSLKVHGFSYDKTQTIMRGPQLYFVANINFDMSTSMTMGQVYMSDVNSDRLVDFVDSGNVLYNCSVPNSSGVVTVKFCPNKSIQTPAPIEATKIANIDSLYQEIEDMKSKMEGFSPLLDTTRFWIAPYSGTVELTGEAELIRPPEHEIENCEEKDKGDSGCDPDLALPDGVVLHVVKGINDGNFEYQPRRLTEQGGVQLSKKENYKVNPFSGVGDITVKEGDILLFQYAS